MRTLPQNDLAGLINSAWPDEVPPNFIRQGEWVRLFDRAGVTPGKIADEPRTAVADLSLQLRTLELAGVDDSAAAITFDPWPDRAPLLNRIPVSSPLSQLIPVPIDALPASVFPSLSVELEWPTFRSIQFGGAGQDFDWQCALPRSVRALRHLPGHCRGWGLGNLLILQLGSELFGISPIDRRGNPRYELLWPGRGDTRDTLGDRPNFMLSLIEAPRTDNPGFPGHPPDLVNEFGHRCAAIGPVCPGYLIMQQKGMLVALDPLDGSELWRRHDLPARAFCYGDDDCLFVVAAATTELMHLDPLDGSVVNRSRCPFSMDEVLSNSGRFILHLAGSNAGDDVAERRLVQTDLRSGMPRWSRSLSPHDIPFEVDHRTLGILHSNKAHAHHKTHSQHEGSEGNVELILRETGDTLIVHSVTVPDQVTRIVSLPGRTGLLLAISGQVTDERLASARQPHQGHRLPMINGQLLSLDPVDLSVNWSRPFPNTVLPLDQPGHLPLFITAETRYPDHPMDSGVPGSRVRCFDRRTGEKLLELETSSPTGARFRLTGNRETELVLLTMPGLHVQFDFADPPEAGPVPSPD